ncbi:hypothetical protein M0R45_003197 [Rubus argutus]|uniref:Uncharacterized protein n=1 Tax=Rubus argutus TaxID=59490 RepID=A0AAW1YH86_RUBAR
MKSVSHSHRYLSLPPRINRCLTLSPLCLCRSRRLTPAPRLRPPVPPRGGASDDCSIDVAIDGLNHRTRAWTGMGRHADLRQLLGHRTGVIGFVSTSPSLICPPIV